MAIVLFGLFALFVFLNISIGLSLGLSAIVTMLIFDFPLLTYPTMVYTSIGKFSLLAIPYFILAGVIMEKAGISKRLVHFASACIGHLHGGMAIVTVTVAVFFAAISGSGPATVAAVGSFLIPAMVAEGYNKGMASSLMAASGGIGIVIPPSIAFVIYGVLAEVSIGKMFIAGIIPGLLVGLSLVIVSIYLLKKDKNFTTKEKAPAREMLRAFFDAFWGLMTPVIILGGIYGGFVTPTEAAGVAVVYGLLVGIFVYKEIKFKDLFKLLTDATVSSASLMFIVANASIFAYVLTTGRIAHNMATGLLALTTNKIALLLIMNVIFLIAGCFLDAVSAMYIFIPILLPIIRELGVDPVLFGVFMTVNLAIGLSTPPVGVNLYVACNVANVKLKTISKAVVPFLIAMIAALMLITYVPAVSLWLPGVLKM